MKRLLALLLLIPLLIFGGCFKEREGVSQQREVKVLEELGYRGLEFYERVGGHTISRHVGKSYKWLVERLKEEPRLRAASSFYDLATAERCVRRAIYFNREKVLRWLRSPHAPDKLVLIYTCSEPVGIKVERVKRDVFRESTSRRVRVILKRDRTYGFIVLTAYPS
ncbi:RNase A-like domain-containing protein [Thermovibrio sp.]